MIVRERVYKRFQKASHCCDGTEYKQSVPINRIEYIMQEVQDCNQLSLN